MNKIASLLTVFTLLLGNTAHLHAQIANGSFSTGDLTGWNSVGKPTVTPVDPSNPTGTQQAFIQSTSEDQLNDPSLQTSASAATIDAALNVTLPSTSGTPPGEGFGTFPPINGQAIYQTFNLTMEATLSFTYVFQTNDYAPFDSTGYVLDGTYHVLATPPDYAGIPTPPTGFAVTESPVTLSLNLDAGTHTLGFVAYNTNDHFASTALSVSDVSTSLIVPTPEPGTWTLVLLSGAGIVLAKKLRRASTLFK